MASNYPAGLDSFVDPGANLGTVGKEHTTLHNQLNDAVEAVQGELGTNPAGGAATVAARLAAIEAARPLTAGEVTVLELAEDTIHPGNLREDLLWDPLHAAWIDYTATSTKANFSTGTGSFSVRYKRVGSRLYLAALFSFGAGSAITGTPTFTAPYAPVHNIAAGSVVFIRNGLAARSSECYVGQDRVVYCLWEADATGLWQAGAPSSGADGDKTAVSLVYEITPTASSLA